MTYLFRLTLILVVISAGVTAAIWLIDHAQPLSVAVLFTNADGTPCPRPCLFGIRPGQTSRAEAMDLLWKHPLTRCLIPNLEGDIFHDQAVSIVLNIDSEDRVASIQIAERTAETALMDESVIDQVIHLPGASDLVVDNHLLAPAPSSPEGGQPILAHR